MAVTEEIARNRDLELARVAISDKGLNYNSTPLKHAIPHSEGDNKVLAPVED